MTHETYLALGTNLGWRNRNIRRAISMIEEKVGRVVRQSTFRRTAPQGFESRHAFLNGVICVHTELSPRQLLHATQSIERAMGRTTKSTDGNYHDRIIDIDILLYDNITLREPDLVIPHPRIAERDFVSIPLAEIRG